MKSFEEFLIEEEQSIEEGLIRASSIAAYGTQSRKHGNDAVRAFRRGQDALKQGAHKDTIEGRLDSLETALDAVLDGLTAMRQQIGAGVAVGVTGHMLSAKRNKTR